MSDFRFSFARKHISGSKQGRESELEKSRCRPQSVLDGARGGGCTADRGMCRIGRWRGSKSKLSPKGCDRALDHRKFLKETIFVCFLG